MLDSFLLFISFQDNECIPCFPLKGTSSFIYFFNAFRAEGFEHIHWILMHYNSGPVFEASIRRQNDPSGL